MKRECTKCGLPGPFYKGKAACKKCYNKASREYNKRNPDRVLAAQLRWRARHPTRVAEISRKAQLNRYGLSEAGFSALYRAQSGKCAICGNDFSQTVRPHVDHSHATGCVRGLLCKRCNTGLGFFNDSTVTLAAAISYLERIPPKDE